jgi:Na+/H+ antiporter NhaD/arsenite permease-like protein
VFHALAIFLATYVLISLRRLAHIPLERPAVALLGASLMMLLRVVLPEQALAAIDLDTILLLIGMMLIVVTLESTGFFGHLALQIVERSKSQAQLLVFLSVTTAVLSALVLNDTVVLFFTPIIIHAARLLNVNPVKFLVVEAISANIGSVATEIGNPQNAYIATASGISFLRYLAIMGPIAAVTLVIAIVYFLVAYRNDLKEPIAPQAANRLDASESITQPGLLRLSLGAIALLFLAFLLSDRLGLPLSLLALSGGSLLVFLAPVVGKSTPRTLFRRVDWSIILLFIGLFIVLKGVSVSGILDRLFSAADTIAPGSLSTIGGLGIVTAIVSNLISNVPAVLLLANAVAAQGSEALWFTLAASSTLAGNATILGAAANIIVAERSEELNVPILFWQFAKVGLPVTIVTLAVALGMIRLVT